MVGLLSKVIVKVSEATKKKEAKLITLNRRDLRAVLKLFYQEGWVDFTLADLEFMFKMSPKTCFKFVCEDEMIGATFALKLENGVCYPNSSIIAEKHRKAVRYHEEVLKYSEYLRSISRYEVMYSAKWLVDLYRDTMGYKSAGIIQRYRLTPGSAVTLNPAHELVILEPSTVESIATYLETVYHSERRSILEHGVDNGYTGYGLKISGVMHGFVMCRLLPKHAHIGPLIAESAEVAAYLLSHASRELTQTTDLPVMLDAHADKAADLSRLSDVKFEKDATVMVKMTRGNDQFQERESAIYSIYSHYLS